MIKHQCIRSCTIAVLLAIASRESSAQERVESSRPSGRLPIVDATWRSRSRTAIGVIVGTVVGGTVGYLISRNVCTRCDDATPLLFGAVLGGVAGGIVGGLASRQDHHESTRGLTPSVVPSRPAAPASASTERSEPRAGCTQASLPAYAHNDYENERPLVDALESGFRGVEVDLFLIDDTLRIGHSRREARGAPRFDERYLSALATLIARCGSLTAAGDPPFLLLLEIKERSQPTYDALQRLLLQHRTMFEIQSGDRPPLEVVMVGWYPDVPERDAVSATLLKHQYRISNPADTVVVGPHARVGLLSLDYGKTMGRFWVTAAGRRRWLHAMTVAKRSVDSTPLRVHNVPVDRAIIAELFGAGVDLIGTKQVQATRPLLADMCADDARIRYCTGFH